MMKQVFISMMVVFLGTGMSAWAAAQQPQAAKASGPDATPTGMGFNMHVAGTDQDWDAIKASGAKLARHDFGWSGTEKVKGEYDFSRYEKILGAMDKRGVQALFILDYRNPLYGNPETTDEGREAYAKWAAEAARHFKGRNVIWEIWNEPNVGFWKGKGGMNSVQYADDYMALVKKTIPAMRAADPDCYILGGSVSCLWKDSFRWLDEVFKQGLLTSGINALSVHPYGFPIPERCLDPRPAGVPKEQGYQTLHEMMVKYNAPKDFPIVNSEVGFPTKNKTKILWTPEEQAALWVRQYLVDQMCGIRFTVFYNWDENDAADMHVRSTGTEPLPVYSALKNMTAELADFRFVERLKTESAEDFVIVFTNGSKARKIIAWTSARPPKDAPDAPIRHEVTVPTAGARVAVRDLYGKAVEAKAGGDTLTLTLTNSPQYVDLSGK